MVTTQNSSDDVIWRARTSGKWTVPRRRGRNEGDAQTHQQMVMEKNHIKGESWCRSAQQARKERNRQLINDSGHATFEGDQSLVGKPASFCTFHLSGVTVEPGTKYRNFLSIGISKDHPISFANGEYLFF